MIYNFGVGVNFQKKKKEIGNDALSVCTVKERFTWTGFVPHSKFFLVGSRFDLNITCHQRVCLYCTAGGCLYHQAKCE